MTLTYFESGEGHKSLTAGEGFWLEELVDGRWVVLNPASPVIAAEKQINVSWTGKDILAVDWSDSYGNLEQGYYRIGRYYTVMWSVDQFNFSVYNNGAVACINFVDLQERVLDDGMWDSWKKNGYVTDDLVRAEKCKEKDSVSAEKKPTEFVR